MITMFYEFNTETFMGHSECRAHTTIFDNYRDVENVERVIKTVRKLFNNKNASNQCVTFTYFDGNRTHDVSRYYRFYSEKINAVIWKGTGAGTDMTIDKMDAKRIREAYLACADYAIEMEAKKAEATA